MPIPVRTLGVPFRIKLLRAPCPILVHSCRTPTLDQAASQEAYTAIKQQTAAGAAPRCESSRLGVNESVLVSAPLSAELRIAPCDAAPRAACADAAEDVLIALADHHHEAGAAW
jgi:hypothetical protein